MRLFKRMKIISFLVFVVFLAMTERGYAKWVVGDGSTQERGAGEGWQYWKQKITNWWTSVSVQPASQERKPASQSAAAEAKAQPAVEQKEVQQRVDQLPVYSAGEARKSNDLVIQQDLSSVRSQKAIIESKPGRAGASGLAKTKSGVVRFDFKVANIPYLDIGEEPTITRNDWQIKTFDMKLTEFQAPKALATPELVGEDKIKIAIGAPIEKVLDAKSMNVSAFGPDEKVSMETVNRISYLIKPETVITVVDVQMMSDEELKLLKAEILLEKGNKCHLATGLLSDLANSSNDTVKNDSNYHLTLCLHKMGLFTESVRRMKGVIRSANRQQIGEAVKLLVADLPQEFEEEIATELKNIDIALVPEESRDSYYYIIAKASARQEHFNMAFENSEKVSRKFKKYPEAQFIMAVSEYALDRKSKALDRMVMLKKYLDDSGGDNNLKALVSLNMARMAFQEKRYKEAIASYLEIKKDHPLWVEGLIEQGWTQLQLNDNAGAIGNMYSIHSPYFKSVYQPESFVVRTIGYLGICQYGDAYRTLSQLEQMHRGWLGMIQAYRKTATTLGYYNSLVKYLKSQSTQQNVDGLPYQVLREIGRHRDFLNIQEAINNRIDEFEQYAFVNGLIRKDKSQVQWLIKKSQERLADYNLKIKKAEKNAEFAKDINNFKRQRSYEEAVLDSLKYELQVFEDSHRFFAQFEKIAGQRVQQRKSELQLAAGEVLKSRLKKIDTRLVSILENNELLRYETFAGSGENIRYHATATGQATKISEKRMPFTAKPENKSLQWQFDGEFWEDEIGHYRSSLKDNCPQNRRVSGT